MKKSSLILILAISIPLISILSQFHSYLQVARVKHNVVKLTNPEGLGGCSGIQVIAPSGGLYILSAAHCRVLANKDGYILVHKDNFQPILRRVIVESPITDLLLIEAMPGLNGIPILGKLLPNGTPIEAYTHGATYATYKATGSLVQKSPIKVMIGTINTPEDEAACKQPKNSIEDVSYLFFSAKYCALNLIANITTLQPIVGGSSGGAAVYKGQLFGIVSAGNEHFSMLVSLEDIQEFIKSY